MAEVDARGSRYALCRPADVVKTGADGSVGITMTDNSLLSAGPNSVLALDRYDFDPTTNAGRFDASLRKGTLAVVSGRLAKQSTDAMTVRTPSAILGVRGTEFVVTRAMGASRRSLLHRAWRLCRRVKPVARRMSASSCCPSRMGGPTSLVVKQGERDVVLDRPYAAAAAVDRRSVALRGDAGGSAGDVR